ncbi:MAG: 2Fe-2S iron-sulfur cluster binding domain-containing protein [Pseudomonadota bacterium]
MTDKAFSIILARSGRSIEVGPDDSILDVLLLDGVDVPSSCQQGICGTCETRVLAGTPEHRDMLLSDAEHAANTTMLICCSRSLTDTLTLDL